jgi:nicotinate-nucleotide adenylyltransferase
MAKLCFGGSFNPIHCGHLICARHAAERLGFSSVVLIPSAQPPHKPNASDLAPAADRVRMCQLAVAGRDGFEVNDLETKRAGPSYTIDTVRELKRAGWDNVSWLIGADMVEDLPTWHEPDALLAEVEFVVLARPGWSLDWETLPPMFRKLRERVVDAPLIDISATEIRRRVGTELPIDLLTPDPVVRFIDEAKLYRAC